MKNQKEIYEALLAGETLIWNNDTKAVLVDGNFAVLDKSYLDYPCFETPKNWSIYKEPKWYENIPEGGVLCWTGDHANEKAIENITKHLSSVYFPFRSPSDSAWKKAKPLTKQEIQVFMDNAPEDL